jgi:hypothetical protein
MKKFDIGDNALFAIFLLVSLIITVVGILATN